jgi:hypothetical protein
VRTCARRQQNQRWLNIRRKLPTKWLADAPQRMTPASPAQLPATATKAASLLVASNQISPHHASLVEEDIKLITLAVVHELDSAHGDVAIG